MSRLCRNLVLLLPLLAACATAEDAPEASNTPEAVGHCLYTNPFSQAPECKEYTGPGWGVNRARAECAQPEPLGIPGTFAPGPCDAASVYGRCEVEAGDDGYALVSPGADPAQCGSTRTGCETFVGGTFVPSALCDGATTVDPPVSGDSFVPPYRTCEPDREGGGAEVCTNVLVSGCTEPGRHFEDYGSCADVRTQRPYFPFPVETVAPPDDARLEDPRFVADLEWAKAQVEACACICCHAELDDGTAPAAWSVDAGPIWIDTIPDSGLAMLAGLVDSSAFGAYPPDQNNGFDRNVLGLPTTDNERMQAFLLDEYARRGLTPDDAAQWPPFGGPLVTQREFEPEACPEGVGVDADGVVRWEGGPARYVYVLEADAKNPGVPPNLDLPEGTLWRLDRADDPMASEVVYGVAPEGAVQRFPAEGAPVALEPGKSYYLHVLEDIALPRSRCLFTL